MGWKPDGFDDFLLADVAGQGKLDDESIHCLVAVQLPDFLKELCFGDVVLEAEQGALEAAGFACQHLVAHVGLAASVVSDKDCCQVWSLSALGYDVIYFCLNLCLDGGSCLFSVD